MSCGPSVSYEMKPRKAFHWLSGLSLTSISYLLGPCRPSRVSHASITSSRAISLRGTRVIPMLAAVVLLVVRKQAAHAKDWWIVRRRWDAGGRMAVPERAYRGSRSFAVLTLAVRWCNNTSPAIFSHDPAGN